MEGVKTEYPELGEKTCGKCLGGTLIMYFNTKPVTIDWRVTSIVPLYKGNSDSHDYLKILSISF